MRKATPFETKGARKMSQEQETRDEIFSFIDNLVNKADDIEERDKSLRLEKAHLAKSLAIRLEQLFLLSDITAVSWIIEEYSTRYQLYPEHALPDIQHALLHIDGKVYPGRTRKDDYTICWHRSFHRYAPILEFESVKALIQFVTLHDLKVILEKDLKRRLEIHENRDKVLTMLKELEK